MATNVSQPGVYVAETLDADFSVSMGATAVPVFVGDFGNVPAAMTRVNGWRDAQSLLGSDDSEALNAAQAALYGYFANGGGAGYVVTTAGRGLKDALAEVPDDVTIVVAPHLWEQGAQTAGQWARELAAFAAERKAMAILHADRDHTPEQAGSAVKAWGIPAAHASFAAVYYPWAQMPRSSDAVAPSAIVAGIWARSDQERGVWKAPANAAVRGITGLQHTATDDEQRQFVNINFLRTFKGTGILVWGARTVAADGEAGTWRYIPVRRLVSTVERDLTRALQFTIFEPNTQATWDKCRAATENYLNHIWKQGGLMGSAPQEAYFVQIGNGITMTDTDVTAGRMILNIGLAAVRPAEFITLQITTEAGQA
ncbi:phage tail sheath family protein [Streptomyces sp. NPDC015139]|uniref:phage tail sheath family protein n=1 Tax=Streptomyces sp. NPDC015139 TaxID=3364942 RepID=UPI0037035663